MIYGVAVLALLAPLANAITFTVPSNLTSGGQATITWTSTSTDPPVFSIELVNQVFHNSFGISNNVQTPDGTITLELPAVPPGDGYTIEAVNITNIGQIFGTSGSFSIAAPVSSSLSSASSTSASGSSASASNSVSAPLSSGSSSGSLNPLSSSNSLSPSNSLSSSSSTSSSSAIPSPSSFGNGNTGSAVSIASSMGSWLAAGVAAVAGGVFVL